MYLWHANVRSKQRKRSAPYARRWRTECTKLCGTATHRKLSAMKSPKRAANLASLVSTAALTAVLAVGCWLRRLQRAWRECRAQQLRRMWGYTIASAWVCVCWYVCALACGFNGMCFCTWAHLKLFRHTHTQYTYMWLYSRCVCVFVFAIRSFAVRQ